MLVFCHSTGVSACILTADWVQVQELLLGLWPGLVVLVPDVGGVNSQRTGGAIGQGHPLCPGRRSHLRLKTWGQKQQQSSNSDTSPVLRSQGQSLSTEQCSAPPLSVTAETSE